MGDAFDAHCWHRAVLSKACTLDPGEALVMLCLVRHADGQGHCYPSLSTIAAETRVSRRKVALAILQLDHRGLVARKRTPRGGGFSNTVYTINRTPDSARLALVQEMHSAPDAPEVVHERTVGSAPGALKLPIELPSVTTQPKSAPRKPRERAKGAPLLEGTHALKLHYVAELKDHRGIDLQFDEGEWGRAMRSLSKLGSKYGLDRAKAIITNLAKADPTYHGKIYPWELERNALKYLTPQPRAKGKPEVQRGGPDPNSYGSAPRWAQTAAVNGGGA